MTGNIEIGGNAIVKKKLTPAVIAAAVLSAAVTAFLARGEQRLLSALVIIAAAAVFTVCSELIFERAPLALRFMPPAIAALSFLLGPRVGITVCVPLLAAVIIFAMGRTGFDLYACNAVLTVTGMLVFAVFALISVRSEYGSIKTESLREAAAAARAEIETVAVRLADTLEEAMKGSPYAIAAQDASISAKVISAYSYSVVLMFPAFLGVAVSAISLAVSKICYSAAGGRQSHFRVPFLIAVSFLPLSIISFFSSYETAFGVAVHYIFTLISPGLFLCGLKALLRLLLSRAPGGVKTTVLVVVGILLLFNFRGFYLLFSFVGAFTMTHTVRIDMSE